MISEILYKEVVLKSKIMLGLGFGILIVYILSFSSVNAEIKAEELIGKETLNFYLASTEDRLIHYGDEYYKRHFLIITFFPAAFTPV